MAGKPPHVTGEAVFTSYDGLRAEANGILGPLTFDCRALEMRSERILGALPPAASGDSALFLQSIDMQGERLLLVGLTRKITDFNKRPGVIGACVSLSEADRELAVRYIPHLEQLFSIIERATFDLWDGRPLPERLNLLDGVPRRETRSDYRFKAGTELLHYAEDGEVGPNKARDACFDLIEASEQVGRVLVLPFAAKGTRPADRRFVESARATAAARRTGSRTRQGDARIADRLMAQEDRIAHAERTALGRKRRRGQEPDDAGRPGSVDDVLRRQDMIEKRLARLERKLKIPAPMANAGIAPADAAFAMPRMKLHRWNVAALAAGAGLTLLLVLFAAGWLFLGGSGSETDAGGRQPVAESSAQEPSGSDVTTTGTDAGGSISSERTSAIHQTGDSGRDAGPSGSGVGSLESLDQAPATNISGNTVSNAVTRTPAAHTAGNSGSDVMSSNAGAEVQGGGGTSNSYDQERPLLPTAHPDPDAGHPETNSGPPDPDGSAGTGSEFDCENPDPTALSIPQRRVCREREAQQQQPGDRPCVPPASAR
ncbi:MAG: hypothetical protein OXH76_21395 [Boseongicola sp.]|nr:hypothetical protein [Boseongicola sp.]